MNSLLIAFGFMSLAVGAFALRDSRSDGGRRMFGLPLFEAKAVAAFLAGSCLIAAGLL